jgi:hypothetical protein
MLHDGSRQASLSCRIWCSGQQNELIRGCGPVFFEDLPKIHRRRERRAYNEVLSKETRGKRPSYYLQNFHFQSGGWMTDDSAERYDTQVEVLLNGAANAGDL